MTYIEYLIKSTFRMIVADKNDTICSNPLYWGTGCAFQYKDKPYVLTVDHVIHYGDHVDDGSAKKYEEYLTSIETGRRDSDGLFWELAPVGGFYFFDKLKMPQNMNIYDVETRRVDFAFAELKKEQVDIFMHPEYNFGDFIVSAGNKILLSFDEIDSPNTTSVYNVWGIIESRIRGMRVEGTPVLKFLTYKCKAGDYLLFNTEEIIADADDWAGLSGAPVIEEEKGKIVGLIASVNPQSKSVFAIPIEYCRNMIETTIRINEIS